MTTIPRDTVTVDLGGHMVSIPKAGLYDRYRMATDLDAIARDPRVGDVEFFRKLPKTRVESPIGPTLTPNYYYRMSSARLTMLARTRGIRARLPEELDPLEIVPGIGLVSVVFYRYDICDIDPYTEAAVGVAVRPARHGKLGVIDLLAGLDADDLDSYVLSLPVNTEIAQVRGKYGYGFPKWVTDIDVDIDSEHTTARVTNDSGGTDLALSVRTPRQRTFRSGEQVSTLSSYVTLDGAWSRSTNQTNVLSAGNALFPRRLELEIGQGRMADDLRSLQPIRTLRLDVVTHGQLALHMPIPTSMPTAP